MFSNAEHGRFLWDTFRIIGRASSAFGPRRCLSVSVLLSYTLGLESSPNFRWQFPFLKLTSHGSQFAEI